MKKRYFIILFSLFISCIKGQSYNIPKYLSDHIIVDSSSTIMIPIEYNVGIFTSDKLKFWGDYYANIIFYNFKTDSSKKLFDTDTYIASFKEYSYYGNTDLKKNMTSSLIFYRVHNVDYNKNGKIEKTDPAILYVSDINGDNLKALTTENENVISIDILKKQNLAFIKFQNDADKNNKYENDDKDYYYRKLDLTTLKFGNQIEIK